MKTFFMVLGLVWVGSIILIALIWLYCKLSGQPFVADYDGEDF